MRLNIVHTTGFRYASPVRASYNEARMTPCVNDAQTVWSSRLSIEPAAWSIGYTDYWGTAVTTFEVHERHSRLTVRSQAVVETRNVGLPWDTERRVPATDLGWTALQDRGVTDSMSELLTVNDRTRPADELAELAQEAAAGQPPRLAGLDVCRLVSERLGYRRGSTEVTTNAREAWQGGAGVCQDYSHVALGALRTVGLPARYVSGYLFPVDGATPGTTVEGESHSWLEWWCGSWVGFDPTHNQRLSDRYVRVGHGRDYGDVSPLRGTYSGGASEMFVTVEMTQLG